MFKFVTDNVGGVGAKRKLTQKSCEPCKKRHKRCSHTDRSDSPQSQASSAAPRVQITHHKAEESARILSEPDNSHSHQSASLQKLPGGSYLRFIGDLSPETSFLSSGGREDGPEKGSRHENVGVWLGQGPENQETDQIQGPNTSNGIAPLQNSLPIQPCGLTALKTLSLYLRQECMSVLPSDPDFKILHELYYTKFDPIFPVLHDEVLENYRPIERAVLKQCICLVAALDPRVKGNLRLPHFEGLLSQIDFRACIASALKQALDLEFIPNKMVVLQVCSLMAFYVAKPQSSDVSTSFAAQAVHYSQTLGLHVGWPEDTTKGEKSRRIFWCIWVLDRINAAANGRPVLIHGRDMDNRVTGSASTQSPAFRLLIKITKFLDNVITKYRPHSTTLQQSQDEYPSFENLVAEAEAATIGNSLLASLEIFHSAIIILWDRPRHVDGECQSRASSNTRLFSAVNIVTLASEELKKSITYWPVLPYAMSTATSVAYKSLRNTSIPYKRKQAYNLFHSSCDALEELGKAFLSARTMAKLAKETLQEVERVAADKMRTVSLSDTLVAGQSQEGNVLSRASSVGDVEANGIVCMPSEQDEIQELGKSSQTAPCDIGAVTQDSCILEFFTDHEEIFGDLDPSFDLDKIDAIFSANLDLTMPLPLEDWVEVNHI